MTVSLVYGTMRYDVWYVVVYLRLGLVTEQKIPQKYPPTLARNRNLQHCAPWRRAEDNDVCCRVLSLLVSSKGLPSLTTPGSF